MKWMKKYQKDKSYYKEQNNMNKKNLQTIVYNKLQKIL